MKNNRTNRKTLAILLSAALVLTMIPASVFAVDLVPGVPGGGGPGPVVETVTAVNYTTTIDISTGSKQLILSGISDIANASPGIDINTLQMKALEVPDSNKARFTISDQPIQANQLLQAAQVAQMVFVAGNIQPGETATMRFAITNSDETATSNEGIVSVKVVGNTNVPPSIQSFSEVIDGMSTLYFQYADFASNFSPSTSGKSLKKITILSLPENGILKVNGSVVEEGDFLSINDMNTLSFKPSNNFRGATSFKWQASEQDVYYSGTNVWSNEASVNMHQSSGAPTITSFDIGRSSTIHSREVTLYISADDPNHNSGEPDQMSFSDDGRNWDDWMDYDDTADYTLPEGDGTKYVYARVRDREGYISSVVYDSIDYHEKDAASTTVQIQQYNSGASVVVNLGSPSISRGTGTFTLNKSDISNIIDAVDKAGAGGRYHTILKFVIPHNSNVTAINVQLPADLMTLSFLSNLSKLSIDAYDFVVDLPLKTLYAKANRSGNDITFSASYANAGNMNINGMNLNTKGSYTVNLLRDGASIPSYGPSDSMKFYYGVQQYYPDPNVIQCAVVYSGNSGYMLPTTEYYQVNQQLIVKLTKPATVNGGIVSGAYFSDLGSAIWAQDYIYKLANKQIVVGSAYQMFSPSNPVKRSEYIKMLVNALGYDVSSSYSTTYSDVSPNAWYYPYIATAQQFGILPNEGGFFSPEANITREDMSYFAYNAIKGVQVDLPAYYSASNFPDSAQIAPYAASAVNAMSRAGIINGKPEGMFDPKGTATRAESSKIISLLIDQYLAW